MTWDLTDYPSSLKNLNHPIRKKAIDIANAMLDEGYKENRAIPIAIDQAKEWYKHTDKKDINDFEKQVDVTKKSNKDKDYSSRPELLEKDEFVVPHKDGWAIQSQDAKKASAVFDLKTDAIKRGKEIAKNKGTNIIIQRKDGTIENKMSYEE